MAHIVNPYNLDDDDDAVFMALLSQGLIWVEEEDDDDDRDESRTLHKTVEPTSEYDIDDVLEAARDFVRIRNEKWVNFTRVSQHLHRTFHNLNPKTLGQANKTYKSLLKLIADYPADFDLRKDPQKQGLYWIRLKQKR